MKRIHQGIALLTLSLAITAFAEDRPVGITSTLMSVDVEHQGREIRIERNQDNAATIHPDFALTSRPCPPFCVQPMQLAPGVETIGELEVLAVLEQITAGDDSLVLIDSRTPDWVARGMIPGAINVPWTALNPSRSDPLTIADLLETQFGAMQTDGFWDFSQAKTLVLYCNGMWCGQSPTNIKTLLRLGYPAHKLKWYRGGMQAWQTVGLTTTTP
ncbi:MAG: rhodanese-like domain-containing protein [Gammaproteobacteria bacterium]|nr:rhodanese-like domain-containing protein [Gammaproteobacteria bacterium]